MPAAPKAKSPASANWQGFYGNRLSGKGLDQTFALGALASQLAGAANRFSALTGFLFGRLFEVLTGLHFPEQAFALHFLLKRAQGLLDIVIADDDLYDCSSPFVRGVAPMQLQCGHEDHGSGAYITALADWPSP